MIPTGNQPRPWVFPETRGFDVALSGRRSRPSESPDLSLWRHALRFAFDALASDLTGMIAVVIAMSGLLLFLLRL
jgi:hypothetical protein